MKKIILGITFTLGTIGAYSQVGIGTLTPNKASTLDVVSENKGILIPRIALQNRFDTTTVTGSENGTYENSLLVFNTTTNSELKPGYYYWFEDKWSRFLNQNDILNLITTPNVVSISVTNGNLIVSDTNGNVSVMSIIDLNIITTLTNNQNGTYSYTSENGIVTVIDIKSDVANNFLEITNHPNVKSILENIITNTKGMVKFNGSDFIYIDTNGNLQTISMQDLIQSHQKIASLTNGMNTNVESNVDASNANHTIWKVNVNTAKGAQNNQVATLGLVKEKDDNPLITINQSGELLLNVEAMNQVKEINSNYNAIANDAILLGNASTNNVNVTLPNASINKGKRLIIKKDDSNENFYITVLGNIHGTQNGLYTALPYSGWEFVSDGNQWRIINKF